jgi:ribulose-5-phosphate 4-epimerase/fuculose-1-phosphate aldolase
VAGKTAARLNVDAMGDAKCALLAHHGVAVVGDDIEQAYYRALVLERRCRQAWFVEALEGAKPMAANGREVLFQGARTEGFRLRNFWDYAVRREFRLDSAVLL